MSCATVYVIVTHEGWGEGTEVRGVYADKAMAEAALEKIKQRENNYGSVEEFRVEGAP